MIWDLFFWLAVAYLAATVIYRFFVVGVIKPRRTTGGKDTDKKASSSSVRTWTPTVIAFLVIGFTFVMKANPDLFKSGWTPEEREMLEHFEEATLLYDQASEMASTDLKLGGDAWESISALLQAALQEAEEVPDELLGRLHPDLQEHFQNEFKVGLNSGIYGLRFYNAGSPKGIDTVEHDMIDSLDFGRDLLGKWKDWYNVAGPMIRAEMPATEE